MARNEKRVRARVCVCVVNALVWKARQNKCAALLARFQRVLFFLVKWFVFVRRVVVAPPNAAAEIDHMCGV